MRSPLKPRPERIEDPVAWWDERAAELHRRQLEMDRDSWKECALRLRERVRTLEARGSA